MDGLYSVYKHVSPTWKVYIGITSSSIEKRFKGGKGYIKNAYFYRAIQKYGWDAFNHVVLADGLTKDEACEMERALIAFHKSNNPAFGYNISEGGESGNAGVTASNETRLKMSESHKGERNSFYGRSHTDETKRLISQSNSGRCAWNKGLTTPVDVREKQRRAKQGSNNPMFGKQFKLSDDALEKVRDHAQSRDYNGGNNPKARRVIQMKSDGTVVKVWDCIKDASEFLGVSHSYLIKIMTTGKSYKGYVWSREVKQ